MTTPNHALAAENAAKIIQKADELGRVGGWDTVDYPVAVAYLALAGEVVLLKSLLKTAADFIRGMPSDCMGVVRGEENDFCAEPDHFVKDEFLHYVDQALAQQTQEGGE